MSFSEEHVHAAHTTHEEVAAPRSSQFLVQNLKPGEQVLYYTVAHWIWYLLSLPVIVLTCYFLWIGDRFFVAMGASAVFSLIWIASNIRGSAEVALTDHRILGVQYSPHGNRYVDIPLEQIESVVVEQPMWAAWFDFGTVQIRTTATLVEHCVTMRNPFAFRDAIQAQLARVFQ